MKFIVICMKLGKNHKQADKKKGWRDVRHTGSYNFQQVWAKAKRQKIKGGKETWVISTALPIWSFKLSARKIFFQASFAANHTFVFGLQPE